MPWSTRAVAKKRTGVNYARRKRCCAYSESRISFRRVLFRSALAYGHRRLVEIARALAVEPRILLLDEPAAGLVAEEIRGLAVVIRKLKSMGMTILLVEHHMDLVLAVSDRITVLDHGAVIAEGEPADIRRNERVIAAYLGPSHAAA